jgi:hypothetical protein
VSVKTNIGIISISLGTIIPLQYFIIVAKRRRNAARSTRRGNGARSALSVENIT